MRWYRQAISDSNSKNLYNLNSVKLRNFNWFRYFLSTISSCVTTVVRMCIIAVRPEQSDKGASAEAAGDDWERPASRASRAGQGGDLETATRVPRALSTVAAETTDLPTMGQPHQCRNSTSLCCRCSLTDVFKGCQSCAISPYSFSSLLVATSFQLQGISLCFPDIWEPFNPDSLRKWLLE